MNHTSFLAPGLKFDACTESNVPAARVGSLVVRRLESDSTWYFFPSDFSKKYTSDTAYLICNFAVAGVAIGKHRSENASARRWR